MKATVIVDNKKSEDLKGEWGLCIYIEYNGQNILLDAGASDLFAENAARLGMDLKAVDAAVLSHAHYDHANGMDIHLKFVWDPLTKPRLMHPQPFSANT